MSDELDQGLTQTQAMVVDNLKPITLKHNLDEDMTSINDARANLFNVVQEQLKGPRVSAMMVQAAAGLLKDMDDSHIKREKLAVDKTMGDAALLVAEATNALLKNGNPFLAKQPIDINGVVVDNSHIDVELDDVELVHNHTLIGNEKLSYDEFSPEGEDDDEED